MGPVSQGGSASALPARRLPRVALLAGEGASKNILYHALSSEFEVFPVIVEHGVSRWSLLRRRASRLGLWTAVGQLLFVVLVVPFLEWRSRGRRQEILTDHGLRDEAIDAPMVHVASSNDRSVIGILAAGHPDVVLVVGTRILSTHLLETARVPFVNIHAGITPRYRGVHGCYWALASRDPGGCGVTVHLVDRGIDTGPVLAQMRISPTGQDDFTTYPLLQLAAAIPALRAALREIIAGQARPIETRASSSRLWSHPTLWGYIWQRLRHGVR